MPYNNDIQYFLKRRNLCRRNNFDEGDKSKMPIINFGDGMSHKDGVPLKDPDSRRYFDSL